MKIVKLQTVATATNLSETKNNWSKHEKNVLKPQGLYIIRTDKLVQQKKKRIAIVVFENLLAYYKQFFIFAVCNVLYSASQSYSFDAMLWFCHSKVISYF